MTQRVLVTAGANGIGLAVARSFTGAQVHVAYIDASAVASVLHTDGVSGSVTDVSDATAVDTLFDDVRRELTGSTCSWTTQESPARLPLSRTTTSQPGPRS